MPICYDTVKKNDVDEIKNSSEYSYWGDNIFIFIDDTDKIKKHLILPNAVICTAITNGNEYPCVVLLTDITVKEFGYVNTYFAYSMRFLLFIENKWVEKWYAIDCIYTNNLLAYHAINDAFESEYKRKKEYIQNHMSPYESEYSLKELDKKMRRAEFNYSVDFNYIDDSFKLDIDD